MKKSKQESPPLERMASAFVVISIIAGISSSPTLPILGPDYNQGFETARENFGSLLDDTKTIKTSEAKVPEQPNEEGGFNVPESLNYEELSQHLLVNDNSLIANKIPPNTRYTVSSRMWIFVTAYSSTPDQTDDSPFITASGNHVRDGIVAANFLPMYTKVRFPTLYGDKVFIVEDRMNKRYYYKADIWMKTRGEALQFGLKNVPIEILREI